jgi:hypothetical protein
LCQDKLAEDRFRRLAEEAEVMCHGMTSKVIPFPPPITAPKDDVLNFYFDAATVKLETGRVPGQIFKRQGGPNFGKATPRSYCTASETGRRRCIGAFPFLVHLTYAWLPSAALAALTPP